MQYGRAFQRADGLIDFDNLVSAQLSNEEPAPRPFANQASAQKTKECLADGGAADFELLAELAFNQPLPRRQDAAEDETTKPLDDMLWEMELYDRGPLRSFARGH